IKGLDHIEVKGSKLHVGALARHVQIHSSQTVKESLPILAEVAAEVGDNQVRNMGTMGGVIAHGDAAGDYPTLALMLDADIVTNKRTIPARDFFKDIFTTALAANEIVTEVVFPVANGPHKYIKFRRRLFDWAIVGAAAQKVDGHWRVGLTNVGPTPVRAKAVAGLMATACGLPFGIGQASTSQLINGAADNLASASGFEVKGKFTTGGHNYTFDLEYQKPDAADMVVDQDAVHLELLQVGGK